GEHSLAGVKFTVGERLILLRGHWIDQPKQVEGIKVGTRFSRLHTLHAAHWEGEKEEVTGYYRLNYEENSRHTIPIGFGRDVGKWWYQRGCSKVPSGAVLAWEGENEDARKSCNATIRLYVSSWENPDPARKVASIDFTATSSLAAPFCVAMTIEE